MELCELTPTIVFDLLSGSQGSMVEGEPEISINILFADLTVISNLALSPDVLHISGSSSLAYLFTPLNSYLAYHSSNLLFIKETSTIEVMLVKNSTDHCPIFSECGTIELMMLVRVLWFDFISARSHCFSVGGKLKLTINNRMPY